MVQAFTLCTWSLTVGIGGFFVPLARTWRGKHVDVHGNKSKSVARQSGVGAITDVWGSQCRVRPCTPPAVTRLGRFKEASGYVHRRLSGFCRCVGSS